MTEDWLYGCSTINTPQDAGCRLRERAFSCRSQFIDFRSAISKLGQYLWAALTLGRPNLNFVFRHGQASQYEALFRLSLVRMALEQRPAGSRLRRTSAFKALDPTEKGAVNYFVGMTFCKLFADEVRQAAITLADSLKGEGVRADGLVVRAGESWLRPLVQSGDD